MLFSHHHILIIILLLFNYSFYLLFLFLILNLTSSATKRANTLTVLSYSNPSSHMRCTVSVTLCLVNTNPYPLLSDFRNTSSTVAITGSPTEKNTGKIIQKKVKMRKNKGRKNRKVIWEI